MTEQELIAKRREKWHLDGRPVRTLEDARSFLDDVGFCLLYPVRPRLVAPTFVGATAGSDERLPNRQQAFSDPRTEAASELMVRLLRSRSAYESNAFGDTALLISPSVFPFFYATLTDHNPKQPPKKRGREQASPLMVDTFNMLQENGPLNKQQLRERLGGELSDTAIDHALHDLWSALKITRVDYSSQNGASWDVLYRWAPAAVREGLHLSMGEALSALISKYVDGVVAAQPAEIEDFFSPIAPRSRVRETVNALLNARELTFISSEGRSLVVPASLQVQNAQPAGEPRRPLRHQGKSQAPSETARKGTNG